MYTFYAFYCQLAPPPEPGKGEELNPKLLIPLPVSSSKFVIRKVVTGNGSNEVKGLCAFTIVFLLKN